MIHRRARSLVAAAVLTLTVAFPAAAAVTPVSYFREVQTFASISGAGGGGGVFDSEEQVSEDPGEFNQTVDVYVEDEYGSTSQSVASQSSIIDPEMVTAAGSFSAAAQLEGEATFAEALGFTKLSYRFSLDTPTPYVLQGSLIAAGSGRSSILLIHSGQGVLVDVTSTNGEMPIFFDGVLEPGDYQYDAWTFGFGQAIAPDENNPASGAFDLTLNLSAPAGIPAAAAGPAALRIWPNPAPAGASILLENIPATSCDVMVIDAAGRRVRSLAQGIPGRATWDLRDEQGARVSPGLYFVRADGAHAGKAIVLP